MSNKTQIQNENVMSVTNALMDVLFLLFRANNTNNGSTAPGLLMRMQEELLQA